MPKKSAQEEFDDLLETLVFTSEIIADSDADSRRRISEAYEEAQTFAAATHWKKVRHARELSRALRFLTRTKKPGESKQPAGC